MLEAIVQAVASRDAPGPLAADINLGQIGGLFYREDGTLNPQLFPMDSVLNGHLNPPWTGIPALMVAGPAKQVNPMCGLTSTGSKGPADVFRAMDRLPMIRMMESVPA